MVEGSAAAWFSAFGLGATGVEGARGRRRPPAAGGVVRVVRAQCPLERAPVITAVVDASGGQVVDVFDGRDAAGLREWMSH